MFDILFIKLIYFFVWRQWALTPQGLYGGWDSFWETVLSFHRGVRGISSLGLTASPLHAYHLMGSILYILYFD